MYLVNEGSAPIQIREMVVGTSINGKSVPAPCRRWRQDVAPQQRALLRELPDLWKEDTTSWSMEVRCAPPAARPTEPGDMEVRAPGLPPLLRAPPPSGAEPPPWTTSRCPAPFPASPSRSARASPTTAGGQGPHLLPARGRRSSTASWTWPSAASSSAARCRAPREGKTEARSSTTSRASTTSTRRPAHEPLSSCTSSRRRLRVRARREGPARTQRDHRPRHPPEAGQEAPRRLRRAPVSRLSPSRAASAVLLLAASLAAPAAEAGGAPGRGGLGAQRGRGRLVVVAVQVRNKGDAAAGALRIEGELLGPLRRGRAGERASPRRTWTERPLRFPRRESRGRASTLVALHLDYTLDASRPAAVDQPGRLPAAGPRRQPEAAGPGLRRARRAVETRGRVPVGLESADGAPHRVRLRAADAARPEPVRRRAAGDVPAQRARRRRLLDPAARDAPRRHAARHRGRSPPRSDGRRADVGRRGRGRGRADEGSGAHAAAAHAAGGRWRWPCSRRPSAVEVWRRWPRRPAAGPSVLRAERPGGVTFLRLARTVAGRPLYLGGAYFAGGVLRGLRAARHRREPCSRPRGPARWTRSWSRTTTRTTGRRRAAQAAAGRGAARPRAGVALLAGGFPHGVYRRVAWGRPRRRGEPLPDVVDAGGIRLEVVHTPGHSPDHVCFFERERGWLFTGDLFLAERLRYLRDGRGLRALLASLRRVSAPAGRARVLCAHRGPRTRTARRRCGAGRPPARPCASRCSTCWARACPRPRSRGGRSGPRDR